MAEQVLMVALSPTMEVGTLVKWNKKEGDKVESGDVLCEVETDKAAMDYESVIEGTLLKILVNAGQSAAVGDVIAIIGEEGEDISELLPGSVSSRSSEDRPSGDRPVTVFTEPAADSRIKASPLARRIAEMNNIPLNQVVGSGPEGRIVKADIEKYIQSGTPAETKPDEILSSAAQQAKAVSAISYSAETIPVSAKRRIIAQRLSESKYSAPHYYLTVSVVVDNLIRERKSLNKALQNNVSFNSFLMKYAAEALKKHSMVNATWQGDTIQMHKNADIALAVAQTDGLITPVVRDCGNKGLIDIDKEMKVLIDKARTNALLPEEYQGATFTVSNLGSYGIEQFTAVINPPGSAILAVGEMQKVPVVDENENIIVQTRMKLTLSCDHRVVDGAVGAAFLKSLKNIIENPIHALY